VKLVLGAAGSMLVHGAILLVMSRLDPPAAPAPSSVVRMEVRESPPPPPPPPPTPPVEEVIPEPTVVPKKVKRRTVKKVVKTAPPPPPPNAPPPPPPTAFAVDMSSTVVAGKGPAVRTVDGGGNMFANPNDDTLPTGPKRTAPTPRARTGDGETAPGEGYEITEEPRFAIPAEDRTPPYPEAAKAEGITGRVLLRIYVNEQGRIARVRVVQGLGGGCTAAAVRWAKEKWRFTPAKAGDQPVGMWITVPVTFVLDR
jgi:protein TonB